MAWACESHARSLGRRTLTFYGGESAAAELAAGSWTLTTTRPHHARPAACGATGALDRDPHRLRRLRRPCQAAQRRQLARRPRRTSSGVDRHRDDGHRQARLAPSAFRLWLVAPATACELIRDSTPICAWPFEKRPGDLKPQEDRRGRHDIGQLACDEEAAFWYHFGTDRYVRCVQAVHDGGRFGRWTVRDASTRFRSAGGRKVAGSNLVAPTNGSPLGKRAF